jgi:catechol 2,3-dioxygenase-like lactoylglutathione lyase family enzyme
MAVQGISHVTFFVSVLERMATLMCDGLGLQEVYDSFGKTFSLSRESFSCLVVRDPRRYGLCSRRDRTLQGVGGGVVEDH